MRTFRWEFQPVAPVLRPYVPLFRPATAGRDVEAVILSSAVLGVWTHWTDGQSVPCVTAIEDSTGKVVVPCPACLVGLRRIWKGYLAVQEARRGRIGVLEVTTGMVQAATVLARPGQNLRGWRIRATRQGSRRNGRCWAEVTPCVDPAAVELPPDFAVLPVLQRIWSVGEDKADG
jgi:hypothetical protein